MNVLRLFWHVQFFVRHGLSREIAKINERIEEINKKKNTYHIQSTPSKSWSLPSTDVNVDWYASIPAILFILLTPFKIEDRFDIF